MHQKYFLKSSLKAFNRHSYRFFQVWIKPYINIHNNIIIQTVFNES